MEKYQLQPLLNEEEIFAKIEEVAKQIDRDFQGKELFVIMIMKGSIMLVADLMRALQTSCTLDFIECRSYGKRGTEGGHLEVERLDQIDVFGKDVLIIDDIFDSGSTLETVVEKLKKKHPKSLRSLVLLLKQIPRKTLYYPDYILYPIENHFVVGYGLDYKEKHRELRGIYSLVFDQ